MWPFPKCLVKWDEPRQFLQRQCAIAEQRARPWHKPLWVLAYVPPSMALWGLAHLDPDKSPPPVLLAIGMTLLVGTFMVYVVPAIGRWDSTVEIFPRHMARIRGRVTGLTWKDVASYSWVVEDDYCVLVINRAQKQPVQIGVPDADTRERIDEAMSDLGIQQSDAGPPTGTDDPSPEDA